MTTAADDVVVVGRIGAAYGVKGWVHVTSYTDPSHNLLNYSPWLIQTPDTGWRLLEVADIRPHKAGYVALFAKVADREAAQLLSGQEVAVTADLLPEAGLDEYYWRDLEGLEVVNPAGYQFGRVHHLLETGANDLLVIHKPAAIGKPIETLVPFAKQTVVAVDLVVGLITIDWEADY